MKHFRSLIFDLCVLISLKPLFGIITIEGSKLWKNCIRKFLLSDIITFQMLSYCLFENLLAVAAGIG